MPFERKIKISGYIVKSVNNLAQVSEFCKSNLQKYKVNQKRFYHGGGAGIKLIEFLVKYIENILCQIDRLRQLEESTTLKHWDGLPFRGSNKCLTDIDKLIKDRVNLLFYHLSRRTWPASKISNFEINQFQMEYKRFVRFIDFALILNEVTLPYLSASQEAKNTRLLILDELKSIEMFSDTKDRILVKLLNDLKIHVKSSSYVSEVESETVFKAMGYGLRQGHWVKCRKGHYYVIGNCGAAVTTGRCIECKETVGGTGSGLAPGNTRI